MQVISNDNIVCCDVDDTLVMWGRQHMKPHDGAIAIYDPSDGGLHFLKPHQRHVQLLKKWKGRGCFIHVWSAGGTLWAESVVKALGLEEFVDLVSSKPVRVLDDLPMNEALGQRIYLSYEAKDKSFEGVNEQLVADD